jgi:carotenoid cleavage dioxygenase-like enzyme
MSTATVPPDSTARISELRERFVHWLRPSTLEEDYEVSDVEGTVPREIHGSLFRNGPSQRQSPPEGAEALHLFDGDGLVRAFRFEDGRVRVQTRFVRTESFDLEQQQGRYCMNGVNLVAENPLEEVPREQPNTNVILHGGRLLALVENAAPFEIDRDTLAPIGRFDYDGRMVGFTTSAHPKVDGRTGQMLIHGYQPFEPHASLYAVEPDGRVSLAEVVETPWPSMMHDMAISENHVVLPLPPVVIDFEALASGTPFGSAIAWEPERGLKFGVRLREAGGEVRWFDAPTPAFLFHPGNAYERDGVIHMDACVYLAGERAMSELASMRRGELNGGLHPVPFGYEFDLATGECREQQYSDRLAEFPRLDDRLVGYENRWGYAATSRPDAISHPDATFSGLLKYDRTGGATVEARLPAAHWTGEPVFVPRHADAAEDDGFVLSVVYDGPNDRSGIWIFDAQDFAGQPLAKLWLRNRLPLGFHGNFSPGVV